MEQSKKKLGEMSPVSDRKDWWKPAVEIFTEVSGWIVGPIVLSLIAGKALDKHFGTKPWIFLGLTCIAFLISSFGIIRIVGKYVKDIVKNDNKLKKNLEFYDRE